MAEKWNIINPLPELDNASVGKRLICLSRYLEVNRILYECGFLISY